MGGRIIPAEEMEGFETGSRRGSREGKGRFDLIPPEVEKELALHFEQGAAVYGDRNWERGQPLGRYLDSLRRHLNQWQTGQRDEPHLRAVVWNAVALLYTVGRILEGKLPRSLDNAGYLEQDFETVEDYGPQPADGDDVSGCRNDCFPGSSVAGLTAGGPAHGGRPDVPQATLERVAGYVGNRPAFLRSMYYDLSREGHELTDIFNARVRLGTVAFVLPDDPALMVAFPEHLPAGARTPAPTQMSSYEPAHPSYTLTGGEL